MLAEVVDTTQINSFPRNSSRNEFVATDKNSSSEPRNEPLLTITLSQLQNLIKTAVNEAIEPLQKEIQELREKITGLEKTQDIQADNQLIQLRLIHEINENKQREALPEPTNKSKAHIDELYRLMIEEKTAQVSILKASRLLRISKERMRQLKPLILADGRFELAWDRQKGQKKRVVIRVRKYIR